MYIKTVQVSEVQFVLTNVLHVPLAPAIEVISPYLKPPLNASSSMTAEPELAGAGLENSCALAAARRLDARSGGAA
jgi:hypothetical protein